MGWEHNLDRWDPYLQELLALKADILATQFIVRALILRETLRKANFDPNQPRSPAGSPNGGQWTREGGGPSSGPTGSFPQEGSEAPAGESAPQRPRLHIEIWPSNGGPPLEDPPVIPETPPPKLGRNYASHATWCAGSCVGYPWATQWRDCLAHSGLKQASGCMILTNR